MSKHIQITFSTYLLSDRVSPNPPPRVKTSIDNTNTHKHTYTLSVLSTMYVLPAEWYVRPCYRFQHRNKNPNSSAFCNYVLQLLYIGFTMSCPSGIDTDVWQTAPSAVPNCLAFKHFFSHNANFPLECNISFVIIQHTHQSSLPILTETRHVCPSYYIYSSSAMKTNNTQWQTQPTTSSNSHSNHANSNSTFLLLS